MKNREKLTEVIMDLVQVPEIIDSAKTIIVGIKDKVNPSIVADLLNNQYQADMLTDEAMYFVIKSLSSMVKTKGVKYKEDLLDVTKYYTEVEIENIETTTSVEKMKDSEMIVFENVYPVIEGKQWSVPVLTTEIFKELYHQGFLRYDYNQQREKHYYKAASGEQRYKAKLYKHSVASICEAMLNEEYYPTEITVNVTVGGEKEIESYYDAERHTFTLCKNDIGCLIDGYHRCSGWALALTKNPKLNQNMKLNIMMVNVEEAQSYILQEAQKNAISKSLLSMYNKKDVYSVLAEEIDNYQDKIKNKMNGKLAKSRDELNNKYIAFDKFMEFLKDNFEVDENDTRERRKTKEYICNGFNEIFSIFKTEIADIKESRRSNHKLNQNAFYIYLKLLADVRQFGNWEDELEKILDKIDFEKGGKLEKLGIKGNGNSQLTKLAKKNIDSYINDVINEVNG